MNETIKSILNRRSVRGFKKEQILAEEIAEIVNCGIWAPSGRNTQNWHFTVIRNSETICELNADCLTALDGAAIERMKIRNGTDKVDLFYGAPTLIVVSGEDGERWSETNCGLAAENIYVAAESLNIGSIIIGLAAPYLQSEHGKKYFKKLGIEENYKPLYVIALGYKAITAPPIARLSGRVTYID